MVDFESNMKLVPFVVNRYFPKLACDEDAFQVGYISLWKSCSLFKPGKFQFSTYAVRGIMNALTNYQRDNGRTFATRCCVHLESNLNRLPRRLDPSFSEMNADILLDDFKLSLTAKEAELLELKLGGYNLRQIGEKHGVSPQWVSMQSKSLREKLDRYLNKE